MTFQQDANTTYVNGQPVAKSDVRGLWAAVDGVVANTAKSFHTRAAAVAAGQAALPAALGLILVDEGDYYTVRGPNQTDDDPLFATAPRWGVRDRIPTQAVVDALITDLRTEVRDGRVYFAPGMESPSGYVIPDFADMVITVHVASGRTRMWRARGAPANGVETPNLALSSNGRWFERIIEAAVGEETARAVAAEAAILTEVRDGRVWGMGGQENPSGSAIAPETDLFIGVHNSSSSFSVWRPVSAPGDGLETDTLKQSADGRWWLFIYSSRDSGLVHRMASTDPSGQQISSTVRVLFCTTGTNLSMWYRGDGSAEEPQVETAELKQDAAGNWWRRALDETSLRAELALGSAAYDDMLRRQEEQVFPGDPEPLIQDREGTLLAWLEETGIHGNLNVPRYPQFPGDTVRPVAVDPVGTPIITQNADGTIDLPGLFARPQFPGDPIILIGDAAHTPLVWTYDGTTIEGIIAGNGGGGGDHDLDDAPAPLLNGNVWMRQWDGETLRFLSDAYMGRTMGFEQIGTNAIAETGPAIIGVLGFGGQQNVERTIPETWKFHVRNVDLTHEGGFWGAEAAAIAAQTLARDNGGANPLILHAAEAIGSSTEDDVEKTGVYYTSLMSKLYVAADSAETLGKSLIVDRLELSLLGGAPKTSEIAADIIYAALAQELRADIVEITQQAQPANHIIVSQSYGWRDDGVSPVALAESKLDAMHPTLQFVVSTPRYPFDLEPGSVARNTADAAAMITELGAIAAFERDSGRFWYCPRLQSAVLAGTTITAGFNALTPLVLGEGEHGFTLDGDTNGVTITNVTVSGTTATVTLSGAPSEGTLLNIAYGRTGDPGDGKPANRSSIRDSWSKPSLMVPGQTLYRHALSAQVAITNA